MVSLRYLIFCVSITVVCGAPSEDTKSFQLTVLHNNDMHARFEQTNDQSGKCPIKLVMRNECYGGFARVATIVNEIKHKEKNVIFLNAGDTYQGTIWYTVHKWPIVARFIQLIGLDAMSLGNHEFDDGVEGLLPFLANITIPVVGANMEFSKEPRLAPYIKPSTVLVVDGTKIGVIGYLTPETRDIANPGKVGFKDEVETIRAEAKRLTNEGISILIAVGHSGYGMDQKIAREVEGIDLVIGGHTNTFLYTGTQPDLEVPAGLYPTIVTQKSGRKVPVVSAYAYTKYMGRVDLTFNNKGEVTHYEGQPILLDRNVKQDENVLAALNPWRERMESLVKEELGKTKVYLDGSQQSCRMRECNMGNLITDAFIQYNAMLQSGKQSGWTDASISILNGGGIRASIDEQQNNGSVTMEDVLSVMPFENGVVRLHLQGKYLKEALEVSVVQYDKSGVEAPGKYLQVSGLQVTYDLDRPSGDRVVSVLVRCGECRVPTFEPLDDDKVYGVITTTFVADGGDGFKVIQDNASDKLILDATESDIMAEYLKRKSPIVPGLERRTRILNGAITVQASLALIILSCLFSKFVSV